MSRKSISLLLISFYFFLISLTAYAADSVTATYTPLAPIQNNGTTIGASNTDIGTYFSQMYQLGVGIATALAVLMVIWGGVEYVTTDAIGGKEEGKERIQNAILGLLLALGSYLILKTINPALLNTNTLNNIQKANTVAEGATPTSSGINSLANSWSNWTSADQQNFNSAYQKAADSGLDPMNMSTQDMQNAGLTSDQISAIQKAQLDQSAQNVYNNTVGAFSGSTNSLGGSISSLSLAGTTFPASSGITNDQALQMIQQSGILDGPIPSDAAKYFPGGVPTAQGYVNLLASIANSESGFNPNDNINHSQGTDVGNTYSEGLFSLTPTDSAVKALGFNSDAALANPVNNTQAAINILKNQIQTTGTVAGTASNHYWGPLYNGK